jgi:hypothetical protein
MSQADWKPLAVWEQTEVRDEDQDVAICFGLTVTMFFRDGHTADKRSAVLECVREYDHLCGPALRWWVVEGKNFSRVEKLKNRDMAPYLLSPKWETPEAYREVWALFWHGGEDEEDANPFFIEGLGESMFKAEKKGFYSFLSASFPVTWWADKVDDLRKLVLRWSTRLRPVHGYGGITLIKSRSGGLAQMHEGEEHGFAIRYPGLEIGDPSSTSMSTQTGIKEGNWITILGDEYLEKLGGLASLRGSLGAEFSIDEYPGGAVIVAGPAPEVGDRNRNIDTPRLRALARVLKPIRVEHHWPVQARGKFSDADNFNAWLARFDDEPEPPS